MNKSHEKRCHNRSKERGGTVNPQVTLVDLAIYTQRVHVAYLISGLGDSEGRVETTPSNGSRESNHCVESRRDCTGLDHTISAVLCAFKDLAEDAKCEEESAPEFKQENFYPLIIVVSQASSTAIIGTEEGRLSHANVPHYNSKISSKDLEADDHQD